MTDLDRLTLAFRLHVAEMIVGADAQIHPHEAAHLKYLFPDEVLKAEGFIDASGERTDAYDDAAMKALDVLPGALDDAAKIALLTEFMNAVLADGEFERDEGVALVGAARLLELSEPLIQDFLDTNIALEGITVDELDD